MTAPEPNTAEGVPTGSGLPPPRYPRFIDLYMKVDRFFVRWLSFSPVTWSIMRANGSKNIPPLILKTQGRKSGKIIEIVLPYFRDGDRYAVVGSYGGAAQHPSWVLNLEANPLCEIHLHWRTYKARAHTATGEEHRRIWSVVCEWYPYMKDYAVTAHPRHIPVVVIETL
jgi:deazaflavin-dependent oxidoreductase (nitroreductase family)